MKRRLASLFAVLLFSTVSATASADDAAPPEPPKKKETFTFEPTAGWVIGRWMGVPLTRTEGALDMTLLPTPRAPVAFDALLSFASGSTENGLDVGRVQIGAGVSSRPSFFRVAGGAHLSLAWLDRRTMPGTIRGIGLGLHTTVEAAIPLAGSVALTVGLRGSADAYDGGLGYEGGPIAGLRF